MYVYTDDAGLHPNAPMEDNPFLYLWIIAAFVSTCYTFTWDIKMDWGLFDKNAGENRFLREEIVYASKVPPLIALRYTGITSLNFCGKVGS